MESRLVEMAKDLQLPALEHSTRSVAALSGLPFRSTRPVPRRLTGLSNPRIKRSKNGLPGPRTTLDSSLTLTAKLLDQHRLPVDVRACASRSSVALPWRLMAIPAAPSFWRRPKGEVAAVFNELECYGGPLDGQTIRLRAGQFEVIVPSSPPAAGSVRRFAVYSVRRLRARRRLSSGSLERPVYVLMYTGEEWRVA